MKKAVKNLILALTLIFSLSFGTVCYAAEETTPQVYYNGRTISETAVIIAQQEEEKKLSPDIQNFTYSVFTTENTIIVVDTGLYSGYQGTNITSYVFDISNQSVTVTITSVLKDLNYSQSEKYDIPIEIK